jgi:hypothetical protein
VSETFIDARSESIGLGVTSIAEVDYLLSTGKVSDIVRAGIAYSIRDAAYYGILKTEYMGGNRDYGKSIDIQVSLINSVGKTISETRKIFFQSIKFNSGSEAGFGNFFRKRRASLELNYEESVGGMSYEYVITALNLPTVFEAVPVKDITDSLTIKIDSVNGVNVEDGNIAIEIITGKINVKLYDSLQGRWVKVDL